MKAAKSRLLVGVVAAVFALAGCGGGSGAESSESAAESGSSTATMTSSDGVVQIPGGPDADVTYEVTTDEDLAAQARDLVKNGTLQVVTRPGVPPYEFIVEGTDDLRGSDIDLMNTIAAKLGLQVEYHYSEFAGILPAMQAKRYDLAIASFGDTPEREKVVDFVDYSTESNSIVTTNGNPKNITGMDSVCGLNISSVEGSVMLGLLQEQNEKCEEKMNITIFTDNAASLLQVQNERADATMYQTGTTAFLIKTSEASQNLMIIDNTEFGKGYNAIAVSKDNSELRDLVQKALIELQDDGVYEQVHQTWGLERSMLDEITVNDGLKYNQPS